MWKPAEPLPEETKWNPEENHANGEDAPTDTRGSFDIDAPTATPTRSSFDIVSARLTQNVKGKDSQRNLRNLDAAEPAENPPPPRRRPSAFRLRRRLSSFSMDLEGAKAAAMAAERAEAEFTQEVPVVPSSPPSVPE